MRKDFFGCQTLERAAQGGAGVAEGVKERLGVAPGATVCFPGWRWAPGWPHDLGALPRRRQHRDPVKPKPKRRTRVVRAAADKGRPAPAYVTSLASGSDVTGPGGGGPHSRKRRRKGRARPGAAVGKPPREPRRGRRYRQGSGMGPRRRRLVPTAPQPGRGRGNLPVAPGRPPYR